MRWQYRDPALLWLFVPAYLAHLVEELAGGFPRWVTLVAGNALPGSAFLLINAVGLVLLVVAIRAASRDERAGWAAIAVATVAGINALAHAAGTLATGVYAPGLFTGIVFYLPLALLTLTRAFHQARKGVFAQGVAAGTAVHAAVSAIAFTLARWG